MKKMAFAIALFILVVSVMGIVPITRAMVTRFDVMALLQGLLCLVGVVSFTLFILKKNPFALLNILWFLPQVVVLAERYVDPVYDAYVERSIYDLTIVINSIIVLSAEKGIDVYLRIGFNVIGIVGLILSILVLGHISRRPSPVVEKRERKTRQIEHK